MNQELERWFPELRGVPYEITSPEEPNYNCIAWAAGDDSRWWEPDAFGLYHWPSGVPRQYTLKAYAEAFSQLGFEACESPDFERGWEKVALFADADRVPTHAARQLSDGTWTSKLGKLDDIRHPELSDVSGATYGTPALILRRRRGGLTSFPKGADP